MSGIGFWELILLFLIGLIVLGPERLPRVANQLGTWLGQARRMSRVLKRQLEDELNLDKEFAVRPRPAPKALPPMPTPAPEHDDTYSPAHAPDSPGTGVGSAMPAGDTQPDSVKPDNDAQSGVGKSPDDAAADEPTGTSGPGDRRSVVGNSKT
jgi:sec-independent protein translocase protein TatB